MSNLRITLQGPDRMVLLFAEWLQCQGIASSAGEPLEVPSGGSVEMISQTAELWVELPGYLVQNTVDKAAAYDLPPDPDATEELLLSTPFLLKRMLDTLVPLLNRLSLTGLELTRNPDGLWYWRWAGLGVQSAQGYRLPGTALDDAVGYRFLRREVAVRGE
jgi:hypothetical protein